MALTARAAAEGTGEARMSEDECIREGVPEQDEALSGSAGIAEAPGPSADEGVAQIPGPSADEGAVDGPGSSIEACPSKNALDMPAEPCVESNAVSDARGIACVGRRHFRVVAAACLLLLVVLAACWILWRGGHPPEVANVVVRPSSSTVAQEDSDQQKVAEGMIGFSINTRIVFSAADAPGDFAFGNPAGNGKRIKLTLVRDDSGSVLAETGLLDPGTRLGPERLDEQLDPGEYVCTAYVDGYRDDGSRIGRVAAGVVVVVQLDSSEDRT